MLFGVESLRSLGPGILPVMVGGFAIVIVRIDSRRLAEEGASPVVVGLHSPRVLREVATRGRRIAYLDCS